MSDVITDHTFVFDYESAQSLGFVAPLSSIFEDIGAKEVIIIIIIIINKNIPLFHDLIRPGKVYSNYRKLKTGY